MATKKAQPKASNAKKGAMVPLPRFVPNGFPQILRTTLRYKEAINLDPTAGQFKTYLYKTNDLYDPNYTGTGHQPMGYDQLAAVYTHYAVLKSRIKVTQITAPANPICFGVLMTDQNGSSGPWPAVCEQPPSCVRFLTPTQGSLSPMVVKHSFDLKKATGVTDALDSSYSGVVGASPSDSFYYVVFLQALDQSTDVAAMWYVIEIEYDAEFAVRKEMASS